MKRICIIATVGVCLAGMSAGEALRADEGIRPRGQVERPAVGSATRVARAVRVEMDSELRATRVERASAAADPERLWVFFTDKGLGERGEGAAIDAFRSRLTERALSRRAKVGARVNVNDLPVAEPYVRAVETTGAAIETRSRWLNAVSVDATAAQAHAIRSLPFVREVRRVARGVKREPLPASPRGPAALGSRSLDYGPSFGQLDQIGVTALHDDGFDGTGVFICMLDTGFDTDHQVFRHLDIAAERDFVNDDAETANQPGDPEGQDSHGTSTLSCVGAEYPGELYGGAYNATFALAKTEIVDQEIQVEEDYWVEAIEWADSLGSDIVSSSLGYFDWYDYSDMDGGTAVTTVAADMAAARGIVVVISMGNEGGGEWRYMIAPADGDSVISIGAVDADGDRVWFSSVGPTYDGRIKPDVMAQGLYVHVATTADTASYAESSGTSFSCPLTASAVGLLLQGHPDWGPADVMDALHATASQSTSPDTLMGWGILDAYAAMYIEPLAVEEADAPSGGRLVWSRSNPATVGARVAFTVFEPSVVTVTLFDPSGRLVRTLADGFMTPGTYDVRWDGRTEGGGHAASGVYFLKMTAGGVTSRSKMAFLR